ncbi:plant cysteine oxidase 2-like [Canna indica]|uniref:cysteine dioxygenase n=1 Tax=Canna indica TaxID=4628 RepID=A0AAQ3KV15_9LILI|nr:plant cysteine oxidase 2-like [Canna indica]
MKVEPSTGEEEEEEAKRARRKRNAEKMVTKAGGGSRRTRRRVQAPSDAIQRLYMACKSVFKGPGTVPEPADVEMLQLLLDKMRPEDVGLRTDIPFFNSKTSSERSPRIACAKIEECENFSMCIFFLPPSAVIPLHNHPGMTVFSKLLLGSMHIKSYDWLDPVTSNVSPALANLRAAKLLVDSDFTAPCNTSILYPTTGGNIHTFRAITPCVVLDVLGPPYSMKDDRDITYYRDHPYSEYADGAAEHNGEKDRLLGWLEEIELSEESKMAMVEYKGPSVTNG